MQYADYSGGRPTGAQLKAAEFSGVIRYIGLGSEGKQLIAAEYRDLVATFGARHVLLVAEAGTGDAWGTDTDDDYARGVAYGKTAVADARAQGVPDWVPLACAADAHAQAFQVDDVVRYARGFEAAVGKARCGFYGFSETLIAVRNAGIGSWYWRCGSEPTATEKQWVNLWQRNTPPTVRSVAGVPCDINDVYHPILQGENDMLLTDNVRLWDGRLVTVENCLAGVVGHAEYIEGQNKQLAATLSNSVADLTKIIVSNEANDVTSDELLAKLTPALLPQLTQGLRDAVGGLADVNLTQEQIDAIAAATTQSTISAFGAKLA